LLTYLLAEKSSYFVFEFVDCERSVVEFAGESVVLFLQFADLIVEIQTLLFPFRRLLLLASTDIRYSL